MKFHNYPTTFEITRERVIRSGKRPLNIGPCQFYDNVLDCDFQKHGHKITPEKVFSYIESDWYLNCRPYYKVYPSITDKLSKMRLDIPASSIPIPVGLRSVAVRFAEGHEPGSGGEKITSILLNIVRDNSPESTALKLAYPYRLLSDDLNPCNAFNVFVLESTESFEDQYSKFSTHLEFDDKRKGLDLLVCKFCLMILLLASDPSIVQPDVLAADREAFDRTGDQKYVDRAKKKGIVGWHVGEKQESCPHFRSEHWGIRHTGKGRTIPKLVKISACTVHRDKLTRVPTGYITPDGKEIEE